MSDRLFEWDRHKAQANRQKHGVDFEEASTVFDDPFLLVRYDPDHSVEEERYLAVGRSRNRRMLLVVHTERGMATRIISARRATAAESRTYYEAR